MAAWGRRLFAGICLIPPLTPIGLYLWWNASRSEKKSQEKSQQAEDIAAMREQLESLREQRESDDN